VVTHGLSFAVRVDALKIIMVLLLLVILFGGFGLVW
jgi:hypothetical protein